MAILKGKHVFWVLSVVGCFIFAGTIAKNDLVSKIALGENGQAAIEMLDAMRRPLLAIKEAENQLFLTNDTKAISPVFLEMKKNADFTLVQYHRLTQYNSAVFETVLDLSKMYEDWMAYEGHVFSSYEKKHVHEYMGIATTKFLNILDQLGKGEDPIHDDISVGRSANNEFRLLVILLFLYLISLIVIQQQLKSRALQAAKKIAEDASRIKSNFLANMSHELRTPLNAIIGFSELVEEELIDKNLATQVEDVRKIHDAGMHLLVLVNEVLDLSKLETGEMGLYLEHFDIFPLLQEMVDTMGPLASEKNNELQIICDENIGSMYADITKIRQVLFNHLSNACKFTEQGVVTLNVRREVISGIDCISFAVSDSGIGMTDEQMGQLFQPFVQGDSSTTRNFGGAGLGLIISRHFCDMMGGTVTMESTLGKGSTFTVIVPAQVQGGNINSGKTSFFATPQEQ